MTRTNSRIKAMFALYNYDITKEMINKNSLDDMINLNSTEEIEFDDSLYTKIVNGVINNLRAIDLVINRNLEDWTIDRLNAVDRALIRIAVYEMLYTDTPKTVIINEILNLTHEYSEMEGLQESRFNNKLLDKIRKNIDGK